MLSLQALAPGTAVFRPSETQLTIAGDIAYLRDTTL